MNVNKKLRITEKKRVSCYGHVERVADETLPELTL
jgi:hypothetical protein